MTRRNMAVPEATPPSSRPLVPTTWIVVALMVVATVTAFWDVRSCGFINLDDDAYVEFQPMVNQGLRSAAVVWAFSAAHSGMWHPLTSLSHMLDCELFGVRPGPMHSANLGWHTLNALLVFFVWRALTGATWRSAMVAALFALHPLAVESVAWISERKNLLTTFFWLLGIGAYVRHARRPSLANYALVAGCLALALLAKPMAVTFPAALLVLDYWPLGRWSHRPWRILALEKIPLLILSAAHSLVTWQAQQSIGAESYGSRFSLFERLGNAVISYVRYLGKMIWPDSLAPFYPHPGQWPVRAVIGAAVLLAAISLVVWHGRRTQPWLVFGWLWFLGTLVPVIGLIQVGAQAMADRYTYIPLLGIYTIVVWSGAAVVAPRPRARPALALASVLVLGSLILLTRRQVPAWANSRQLYTHSIGAGVDSATSRYLLAVALQAAGCPEAEIVAQYRRALEIQPNYLNACTQLCAIALRHQRFAEARELLDYSMRLEPRNPAVHKNMAVFWRGQGRPDQAIAHLQEAIRLNPNYADAYHDLAGLLLERRQLEEARAQLETVLRLTPWDFVAHGELGVLLANLGQLDAGRRHLERALRINPSYQGARDNMLLLDQLIRAARPAPAKPPG